ncbi:MAG: DinB family protein, partial [Bacteroidota bacterium]
DVEFKEATTPYKSLNTIALLTFHINYYMDGVLQVFRGGELTIRDKYSFDMPPLANEQEWLELKDRLIKNAEEFTDYLSKLTDDQIESHFVNEKYGNYNRNMNGMIEHCYYHLGQIAIIKK